MAKSGGMFDSRTDGFLPLQDFRKPGSDGGVMRLDFRAGLYAVRIIGRRMPLGRHVYQDTPYKAVGDVLGGSFWEPVSTSLRPVGAWRFVTPCVCDDGAEHDEIGEVNTYAGPGGEVGAGSRDPYEKVTTLGASSRLKLTIDGPGLGAQRGVGF